MRATVLMGMVLAAGWTGTALAQTPSASVLIPNDTSLVLPSPGVLDDPPPPSAAGPSARRQPQRISTVRAVRDRPPASQARSRPHRHRVAAVPVWPGLLPVVEVQPWSDGYASYGLWCFVRTYGAPDAAVWARCPY